MAELAKGRLRPKIPALAGGADPPVPPVEHHGALIAQMLAHIDFLESVDPTETHQRIEVLLRPVADVVELVMTIPGVGRRSPRRC